MESEGPDLQKNLSDLQVGDVRQTALGLCCACVRNNTRYSLTGRHPGWGVPSDILRFSCPWSQPLHRRAFRRYRGPPEVPIGRQPSTGWPVGTRFPSSGRAKSGSCLQQRCCVFARRRTKTFSGPDPKLGRSKHFGSYCASSSDALRAAEAILLLRLAPPRGLSTEASKHPDSLATNRFRVGYCSRSASPTEKPRPACSCQVPVGT